MIPISYDLEKQEVRDALVPYNDFVRHFKNKTIEGAIKRDMSDIKGSIKTEMI